LTVMRDTHTNLMRRLAGEGRPEPEIDAMGPAKALRLALSRAGQDVLGVEITAGEPLLRRCVTSSLAEFLPQDSLTVLLSGTGGARGLLSVDCACLDGLTQALTTGRVNDGADISRKPTETDAQLCRRFFAAVMSGLAALLADAPHSSPGDRFAIGGFVPDPRRLAHLMPDTVYRLMDCPLAISGCMRTGRLVLVVPMQGEFLEPEERQREVEAWNGALRKTLGGSEMALDVILYRYRMQLSRLSSLRPGDILPLPGRSLAEVSLESAGGACVAQGHLGQTQGVRAVRLNAPGARKETGTAPSEIPGDGDFTAAASEASRVTSLPLRGDG
jgi:flagellar motor switch protein FliM